MALFALALLATGCKSREVVYARATRLPEEVDGMLRIATEEPVRVNVIGTGVLVERPLAGYVVLHEQDAAELVRIAQEAQGAGEEP